MKTPTFKEQFDKIDSAYNNDMIDVLVSCGCFIGTMLNNESSWSYVRDFNTLEIENQKLVPSSYAIGENCIKSQSNGLYSAEEIIYMERNFILKCYNGKHVMADKNPDENDLFLAINSTLKMLRTIHESKGETVEDYTFTKRQTA